MLLVNYFWSVLPKDKRTFLVMLTILDGWHEQSLKHLLCVPCSMFNARETFGVILDIRWLMCVVLGVALVVFGFVLNIADERGGRCLHELFAKFRNL